MKRTATFALAMLLGALCIAAIGAASASALPADGNQGWYWQMPQPSGDWQGLYDVAMPAPSQAWAVGAGGLILHSVDAGASWSPQTSGTTGDLWSAAFADDHDGWALGDVLLKTTDAGTTWSNATPPGAKGLTKLSVVGPDEIWVTAQSGVLLHTVDGGASWQTHRVKASGQLSVDFADSTHGWLQSTRRHLWRTVDGGATWRLVTTRLPSANFWASDLRFTDTSHGWLEDNSTGVQVWRTSDGGAKWRRVFRAADSRGTWGTLVPTDSTHAWLAEQVFSDTPFDAGNVTYLQRTGDGGASWSRTCIGSTPVSALAANGDTLIGIGGAGPSRSTDGGATWTSGVSAAGYSFTAAQAVGPSDVWATDANGALLHTTDGLHWQEQPDPVRWSSSLSGLSFPDAADGWVVGSLPGGFLGDPFDAKPLLLHTANGGVSWKHESSPLSGSLHAVDFVDAQHGWVVSSWDEIARTADGGQSWTAGRVAGASGLSTIDFVDAQHGWVAGSYDRKVGPHSYTEAPGVFATTDGGATWHRQITPGSSGDVHQVQFLDTQNGWAVGSARRGWVAHTTDGGRTWTRLAGFADEGLSGVRFTDPSHGWLGGDLGVYATSDGGKTWSRVADSGNATMIAATDAQHVWGLGDGTLVSTVDGSGDIAAPTTLDDADWRWHNAALTLHLWPSDIGGSGLAGTRYSLDGGATWQSGTSIDFAAPADHSADGGHEVLYRSSDAAGNVEATAHARILIDTLGPKCAALKQAVVDAGSRGILRFKATDATSGIARATITISALNGRVLRTLTRRAGNWDQYPRPPYFWIRFTADLKPGHYRITVRAIDQAGNAQVRAGHSLLHVVRSGAPKLRTPGWSPGLPANFFLPGAYNAARASFSRAQPHRAVTSPWGQ
jgi:photosystem II stability/assembly factor-like uncharacterized protein